MPVRHHSPARRGFGALAEHAGARRAVTAGAVAVVLWPVRRWGHERPRDSFPLSHYPMFTRRRGSHLQLAHLRGVLASGGHVALPSSLAASGGMNQERKSLRRAARRDSRSQRAAARAARKVARRAHLHDVVAVELVDSWVPLEAWKQARPLVGEPATLLARAVVVRPETPADPSLRAGTDDAPHGDTR